MKESSKNTTRENVLACLEQNKGAFISGGQLASSLGLSRNSVWKAIESLRGEGYEIEAVTRKGYRLSSQNDILSEEGIRARFQALVQGADPAPSLSSVYVYPELESTNRTARDLASDGAPHGTLVMADRQTRGAGHKDSRFFSPPGGLYMSLILRPDSMPDIKPEKLVACASGAVIHAIYDQCGQKAEAGEYNRLYLNGKKICGILSEGVWDLEAASPRTYIVGIGIHYATPRSGFPPELADKVGSVFPDPALVPAGATRDDLAARICFYLFSSLS